jgi:ABC-type transporter Mla subunit MlaD
VNNDIPALAADLGDSTTRYRRILEILQTMEREIHRVPHEQLQKMTQSLSELQDQARDLDSSLQMRLMGKVDAEEVLAPLLVERQEVIGKILVLNDALRNQAQSAQSLLAHELGALRQGHTALCGYKSLQVKAGKIVNSAT